MNLFTSLDPSVKKLLGWKMGDEEEKWALKAVESLVKKMQKRKNHGYGTVEDLEYALSHPGSASNCVTIPRSLDGRLQVSHRKGLPHVIYCRVWRSTTNCMFPYDGRSEQICINPYHYHRIDLVGQQSVVPVCVPSSLFCSSSSSVARSIVGTTRTISSLPRADSLSTTTTPSSSGTTTAFSSVPSSSSALAFNSVNGIAFSSTISGTTASLPFTQSPSALSDDDDFVGGQQLNACNNNNNNNLASSSNAIQKLQHQTRCWCSVCYYELNSRVGEPFKVFESAVVIDGFTNPSSEGRICLGLLSNVNRNATIENTRRHIGMGIRLMCTEDSVLLLNQSDAAVFVQSRNANFKYSLQPTAVCRVPSGATMVIFDCHLFTCMLEKAKEDGYQHVYEIVKMCFVRLSFVKGWGADYPRQVSLSELLLMVVVMYCLNLLCFIICCCCLRMSLPRRVGSKFSFTSQWLGLTPHWRSWTRPTTTE